MISQFFQNSDITIDTTIPNLGTPSVPSPISYCQFVDEEKGLQVLLDSSIAEELGDDVAPLKFELAGPRQNLYFDTVKTKCAIVTCGGLCPGINDVIRAIVMEAHHNYHVSAVLGIRYGLEGFIPKYGHTVMELTPENVSHIHQFGGTILGSSRGPQDPAQVVDALERMNIGVLFMIGGDGTMKAAHAISSEVQARGCKISIIGVPKTIDNDINFVSQSFGFETAVDKATEAIQCAHTEALGMMNGIGIVKLMGRESGFIAAQATLSLKEVNFALVPEMPLMLHGENGLLPMLKKRLQERGHAVIVVAEGAGQELLQQNAATDKSGNVILSDISALLRREIKEYLTGEGVSFAIKFIDPSYIIRSVPANANDRVYCGFLGQHAVHAAMAGKTGMVIARLMGRYAHLPLPLVTQKRRKMDIHSDFWRSVLESTGQTELAGMVTGCKPTEAGA